MNDAIPQAKVARATKALAAQPPGIWTIMRPVQGQIRVAMGLAVLAIAASLGSLGALAWGINDLIQDPRQMPWMALLLAAGLTLLACALRLLAFFQSHYAAFRLEYLLRTRLASHLGSVPQGFLQHAGSGALAKVIQDDVKALHVFVADSTPLYARAFAAPILTFILLWWLDWRLALAATSIIVIGFAVLALAMRDSATMVRRYNEAREQVSAAVVEYVQAMPVVRTFDTGTTTFGRYQQALERYRDVVTHWYRIAGFSSRFSMAILNAMPTLAVLLWLGAWLVSREQLPVASWIAVLLIGAGMAESMMPLMTLRHLVARAEISVRRIQEVLAEPVQAMPEPQRAATPRDATVRFDRVSFRYQPEGPDVLTDISFSAGAGTVTALVGPSGAGKSTVARLVPRHYDVSSGQILVGGVDVRHCLADTLLEQVAVVFQDTFLFSDSIADNIRLGRPEASLDEVMAAARAAQAHDFITALPRGYDSRAGERGSFLSGGQRQRITIARAILQDRPVLILDEATAFADPENEAALITALSNLMRGKTVLMVAHRLSTIRDADQILVLDQGRLIEAGRHDELLAHDGRYARMWRGHEAARHWTLGRTPAATAAATAAAADTTTTTTTAPTSPIQEHDEP